MHINLQERREIEFERFVAEVYAIKPDGLDMVIADTPWGPETVMRAGVPCLVRRRHTALAAKVWCADNDAEWGPLPMGRECVHLLRARGALFLLGCYSPVNMISRMQSAAEVRP